MNAIAFRFIDLDSTGSDTMTALVRTKDGNAFWSHVCASSGFRRNEVMVEGSQLADWLKIYPIW